MRLVETTGVEPVSENPLIGPSSQTVCYLKFPLSGVNRHTQDSGIHFFNDRLNGETPMHFYHCHDAPNGFVVLPDGTGGIKSRGTAFQQSTAPKGRRRLLKQPEQLYRCRLLFKFEPFTRLLSSLRLSDLGVPVETFTSPYTAPDPVQLFYHHFYNIPQ